MGSITVRLTDEEHGRLTARAGEQGISVSDLVRQLVRDPEGAQDSDDPAFRYAVADHEHRLAELEAWHARSKEERAAWEARGWVSPSKDGRDKVPMKLAREI